MVCDSRQSKLVSQLGYLADIGGHDAQNSIPTSAIGYRSDPIYDCLAASGRLVGSSAAGAGLAEISAETIGCGAVQNGQRVHDNSSNSTQCTHRFARLLTMRFQICQRGSTMRPQPGQQGAPRSPAERFFQRPFITFRQSLRRAQNQVDEDADKRQYGSKIAAIICANGSRERRRMS